MAMEGRLPRAGTRQCKLWASPACLEGAMRGEGSRGKAEGGGPASRTGRSKGMAMAMEAADRGGSSLKEQEKGTHPHS